MRGTIQDFKQKYHDISDEELLAINRDELVETARPCLDAEIAARSLTPKPPPVTVPEEELPPLDQWVTIGVFGYPSTTQVVQSALESAGIPNFQPDQNALDAWQLTILLGGRRVIVPPAYAEQAREVLGPTIAEGNKFLLNSWFEEVWNGHKDHAAADYGASVDPDLRAALPDLHVSVEEMVAEANKVVARIAISGTHNQKAVEFHGVVIARIEAGRIEDIWAMNDAPVDL